MLTPDETRRVERVAVKMPVIIKIHPSMEKDFTLAQKEINAVTIDISATGIGVLSNVYIQDGVLLIVQIAGEGGNKIDFVGEVMSSRMAGKQYRLGIIIKEINDNNKAEIMKLMKLA
jgi:hypothetical protein